jgi:pimeloyl-ACP methyl ester carboxylesterase
MKCIARALHALLVGAFAAAAVQPGAVRAETTPIGSFGPQFTAHTVVAGGRVIHYRSGGSGRAVVLLHGFADTGEMWIPLAPQLVGHYRVIIPDLPGLGQSRPAPANARYDMATVARSLHALLLSLHVRREAIVSHDIGLMLAYAYAAQYRNEVTKLALIDAPVPGLGPWQQTLLMPGVWHFNFHGKYAEELVAGRERIYLNRIWDDFAAHPDRIANAKRTFYAASYAQPGNMHAGFSYFAAFSQDAGQNVAFAKRPLSIPVLAMGGAKSFGGLEPQFARALATSVITSNLPDCGHWIEDECPASANAIILQFLQQ